MAQKIRPGIEPWLAHASGPQRIAVDEYIGLLDGYADGASVHSVIDTIIEASSIDYLTSFIEDNYPYASKKED